MNQLLPGSIWGLPGNEFKLSDDLMMIQEAASSWAAVLVDYGADDFSRSFAYPLMCMADRVSRIQACYEEVILSEAERIREDRDKRATNTN